MFIQQMSVDFTDQNPAVFVTEPRGNCHEVNSSHDAERTEQMPQIVKPDLRQTSMCSCQFEGLAEGFSVDVLLASLWAWK